MGSHDFFGSLQACPHPPRLLFRLSRRNYTQEADMLKINWVDHADGGKIVIKNEGSEAVGIEMNGHRLILGEGNSASWTPGSAPMDMEQR